MRKAARQSTKQTSTTTDLPEASAARADSGRELMQAVLAKPRKTVSAEDSKDKRITGIVIGTLSEAPKNGRPMVYYPGIPTGQPLAAISTESLDGLNTGREVALGFIDGDPTLPIILGLIQKTGKQEQTDPAEASEAQRLDVQLDGDRLTLSADREIVLKCGKSSITLTRAGKVILKGAYLSTHSTGLNRIKGGAVQIN